jgi:hypothetical protein
MQAIDLNTFRAEHRDLDKFNDAELRELSVSFRALAQCCARDLVALADRREKAARWRWLSLRALSRAMRRAQAELLAATASFEAVETLRNGIIDTK